MKRSFLNSWVLGAQVVALGIFATRAEAETYHRFWRGVRLPALSAADFQATLNATFLPATVHTGSGQGLIGYQPVLINGEDGLPDEVALVSYESQAKYDALMATPEGKAYVALHRQLFDPSASGSMVPEADTGVPVIGHAYDLHPDYDGWQTAKTVLWVAFRHPNETDAEYLARFQTELNSPAQDHVALVTAAYWLDYVSTVPGHMTSADADLAFPIVSGRLGTVQLSPGHGLNLQFGP